MGAVLQQPRQAQAGSLYGDDGRCWGGFHKAAGHAAATPFQGTPFLYQGEEIGMTNVSFPPLSSMTSRRQSCYRQMLLEGASEEEALRQAQLESRDNARTPCSGTVPPGRIFSGNPLASCEPQL